MPTPDSDRRDGRQRRGFLAALQHELRTPANAIIGYGRMLLADYPAREVGIRRMLTAGEELLHQINEFVDHEKLGGFHIDHQFDQYYTKLRNELRTPMHVVLGYGEMLLDDAREDADGGFRRDIARVVDAASRLLSTLDAMDGAAEESDGSGAGGADLGSTMVDLAVTTLEDLGAAAAPKEMEGAVLIVDDDEINRDILARHLSRRGFDVSSAENGHAAMHELEEHEFDLVLLDIIMPKMNGYQVLAAMKAAERLRNVPVIMVSAIDDLESIVRCIELGADDYLPKTFNPTLLDARLAATLEKKRLRDREQLYLQQIRLERERSDGLLSDVLPEPIAARLKLGEATIADSYEEVTVLFCDVAGFTRYSARTAPPLVVRRLNELFSEFDRVVYRLGLEKIKTVGDAYLLVGGLPVPRPDHAEAVAAAALELLDVCAVHNEGRDQPLALRLGLHTGPVVAGVIGRKRFTYDIWGDTVNVASRMEALGTPGRIQVSETSYERLRGAFRLVERGTLEVKGKGEMKTYYLEGRR